jgi:hypothetical protein
MALTLGARRFCLVPKSLRIPRTSPSTVGVTSCIAESVVTTRRDSARPWVTAARCPSDGRHPPPPVAPSPGQGLVARPRRFT